ncbi:hypothetical protein Tco_0252103 [Tanacetum coccineum]
MKLSADHVTCLRGSTSLKKQQKLLFGRGCDMCLDLLVYSSYGLEAFWQQIEKEIADACDTGLKVIKTVLVFVITTAIDRGRFMLPMDNLCCC